jgi:hypothetical protein
MLGSRFAGPAYLIEEVQFGLLRCGPLLRHGYCLNVLGAYSFGSRRCACECHRFRGTVLIQISNVSEVGCWTFLNQSSGLKVLRAIYRPSADCPELR